MLDLVYILITAGFFGLSLAYLEFCDWLKAKGRSNEY